MAEMHKKERLLLTTLLLTVVTTVCAIIGTVTTHWYGTTSHGKWQGYGTFCRNSDAVYTDCLPTSVDALCVVSVALLFTTLVLGILLFRGTIKTEIVRYGLVGVLFVASVLLLAILPFYSYPTGFSFQLMMTACAFTQLMLLISGVLLGATLRGESSDTIPNYTEQPLLFLTRGLTVLIALFTIVGMSTSQWLGQNTTKGWDGDGTFCRTTESEEDECGISRVTTILSVTAAILSLVGVVFVVCGIFNAIQPRVERYTLTVCLFATAVILWSTIATTLDSDITGYSYRLIIVAGPFAQLALVSGGTWLGISREPDETVTRWF